MSIGFKREGNKENSPQARCGASLSSSPDFDQYGCNIGLRSSTAQVWIEDRFGKHPFHNVLQYWSEKIPKTTALREFDIKGLQVNTTSYEDLYKKAACIALYLQNRHSIEKGDRLLFCFTPGSEFVEAFLGCLFLGAVGVPAYPPDPRKISDVQQFQKIVNVCKPKIIITNTSYLTQVGIRRPTFYVSQSNVIDCGTTSSTDVSQPLEHSIKQSAEGRGLTSSHSQQTQTLKLPWITLSASAEEDISLWKRPSSVSLDQIVLIQFTSGSTRDPEGVAISYQSLIFNIHACMYSMRGGFTLHEIPDKENSFDIYKEPLAKFFDYVIQQQQKCISQFNHPLRFITWLPLYHDMGLIGSLLSGLFAGSELLMVSPFDFLKKPELLLQLISEYQCVGTTSPNFGLDLLVRKTSSSLLDSIDLKSINESRLLCGAEPVRLQTFLRFFEKFRSCGILARSFNPSYGLAENTLIVASMAFEDARAEPLIISIDSTYKKTGQLIRQTGGPWRLSEFPTSNVEHLCHNGMYQQFYISCGIAFPSVEIHIINPDNLKKVPLGHLGEIWITSPCAASGYWGNIELSKERLFASFIEHEDEKKIQWSAPTYIRTGDWGFLLEYPKLEIGGRSKDGDRLLQHLFIAGRLKDTFIIRGRTFHAKDIEEIIEEKYGTLVRGGRVAAFAINSDEEEHITVAIEIRSIELKKKIKNERQVKSKESKDESRLTNKFYKWSNDKSEHSCNSRRSVQRWRWFGFGKSNAIQKEILQGFSTAVRHSVLEELGVAIQRIILMEQHSLPVTSSGKIRRQETKNRYKSGKLFNDSLLIWEAKKADWTSDVANFKSSKYRYEDNESPSSFVDENSSIMEVMKIISDCLVELAIIDVDQLRELSRSQLESTPKNCQAYKNSLEDQNCTSQICLSNENSRNQPAYGLFTSFDSLDIDSLAAVELVELISKRSGLDIPPTTVFDFPTLSSLAHYIYKTQKSLTTEMTTITSSSPSTVTAPAFAIIGASCRFPANTSNVASCWSVESFWNNVIRVGTDAVVCPDGIDSVVSHDCYGAFLSPSDLFPPFRHPLPILSNVPLSQYEFLTMDPHQRLVLTVGAETLQSAGYDSSSLINKHIGVFVGCCSSGMFSEHMQHNTSLLFGEQEIRKEMMATQNINSSYPSNFSSGVTVLSHRTLSSLKITSSAPSIIANRISHLLGLKGPSMVIDTACSSSLVAFDAAVQYLSTHPNSSGALIAGVNLMLSRSISLALVEMGALSPNGRCKTFDATADGYGRGEGCGALFVVPWQGKNVLCIDSCSTIPLAFIRGTSVNQNGQRASLTTPHGLSQVELIQTAFMKARLSPLDIHYIECHGSGTKLGDPIEIHALEQVFKHRPSSLPLHLGSVKTNIGHSEGAAGIAGLIKLLLTLGYQEIPPVVHFSHLNPLIDLNKFNGRIQSINDARARILSTTSLPSSQIDSSEKSLGVFGGVSSLGFGGTNAHVIIEGYQSTSNEIEQSYGVLNHKKASSLELLQPLFATIMKERFSQPSGSTKNGTFRLWKSLDYSNCLPSLNSTMPIVTKSSEGISLTEIQIHDIVVNIMHSLLQQPVDKIPMDIPFVELGIDSLMATELSVMLSNQFGLQLLPTALFNYPTVEALTEYIAESLKYQNGSEFQSQQQSQVLANLITHSNGSVDSSIAVVSIACRFPGQSNSLLELWEILCGRSSKRRTDTGESDIQPNLRDCMTDVPLSRWNHLRDIYDPTRQVNGKSYAKEGGFLSNDIVECFDHHYFGMSHAESETMDPNQRLMLTVSAEALLRSYFGREDQFNKRHDQTGVFVGFANSEWAGICSTALNLTTYSATGMGPSLIAGRISHQFGLKGPSLVIDTACSSSLVALDVARMKFEEGIIDAAIVGGVSIMLSPNPFIMLSLNNMLSPEGRCRPFDARADGYCRGEGCGAVVLRKMSSCIQKNIPILSVLKGSAINHDGRSASLTAPNGIAQQRVITMALCRAGLNPEEIHCLECHGTGTPLGDPIEIVAIAEIFSVRQTSHNPLILTAVKGNIGHLEAAAGIAGFIKAVLTVITKRVPSICHFRKLNPYIQNVLSSFPHTPIRFSSESDEKTKEYGSQKKPLVKETVLPGLRSRKAFFHHDWSDIINHTSKTMRAGISSFSFSGTNAHVVIESPLIFPFPSLRNVSSNCLLSYPYTEESDSDLSDTVLLSNVDDDNSFHLPYDLKLESTNVCMLLESCYELDKNGLDSGFSCSTSKLVHLITTHKRFLADSSYRRSFDKVIKYLKSLVVTEQQDISNAAFLDQLYENLLSMIQLQDAADQILRQSSILSVSLLSRDDQIVLSLIFNLTFIDYWRHRVGYPEVILIKEDAIGLSTADTITPLSPLAAILEGKSVKMNNLQFRSNRRNPFVPIDTLLTQTNSQINHIEDLHQLSFCGLNFQEFGILLTNMSVLEESSSSLCCYESDAEFKAVTQRTKPYCGLGGNISGHCEFSNGKSIEVVSLNHMEYTSTSPSHTFSAMSNKIIQRCIFHPLRLFNPTSCYPWWPSNHPLLDTVKPAFYGMDNTSSNDDLLWILKPSNFQVFSDIYFDHQIHQTPILPASGLIELFCSSLLRICPTIIEQRIQITLNDIDFIRPYVIADKAPINFYLVHKKQHQSNSQLHLPENVQMAIRSNSTSTVHTSSDFARAMGFVSSFQSTSSIFPKLKTSTFTEVNPQKLYDQLASVGLNYGSSYRTVNNIYLSDSVVIFTLRLPFNEKDNQSGLLFHPAILDGALHASASLPLFRPGHQHLASHLHLMLPSGARRVSLIPEQRSIASHTVHAFNPNSQYRCTTPFNTILKPSTLCRPADTRLIFYVGRAIIRDDPRNDNHIILDVEIYFLEDEYEETKVDSLIDSMEKNRGLIVQLEGLIWSRVPVTSLSPALVGKPSTLDTLLPLKRLTGYSDRLWIETFKLYHPIRETFRTKATVIFIDPPEHILRSMKQLGVDPIIMSDVLDIEVYMISNNKQTIPLIFYFACFQNEIFQTSKVKHQIKRNHSVEEDLEVIVNLIRLMKIVIRFEASDGICVITLNLLPELKKGINLRPSGIISLLRAVRLELEATLQKAVYISVYDLEEYDAITIYDIINDMMGRVQTETNESEILVRSSNWKTTRISNYQERWNIHSIDLGKQMKTEGNPKPLDNIIQINELSNDNKLENQENLVPRNGRIAQMNISNEIDLVDNCCWIIIGGCGSLGQLIAQWLLKERPQLQHIVLLTSQCPNNISLADDLELHRVTTERPRLSLMQKIYVIQCDICDEIMTKDTFELIRYQLHLFIQVAIHAAGILSDASIPNLTEEQVVKVFNVKAQGVQNIDNAWNVSKGSGLLIIFSSTASLIGNFGQCHYAAANGYLDTYARLRSGRGHPTVSIQWGPWERGMSENVKESHKKAGIHSITENEGLGIFADIVKSYLQDNSFGKEAVANQLITEFPSVLAYQHINWKMVQRVFKNPPLLFENVLPTSNAISKHDNDFSGSTLGEISELVNFAIDHSITKVLDDQTVSENIPILDLGLDSLGLVEFRQLLSAELNIRIPATAIFDYPTLTELKMFLVDEIAKSRNVETSSSTFHMEPPTEMRIVANLSNPAVSLNRDDPIIAITGMACRFPKGNSVFEFWQCLYEGKDCISTIPEERWDINEFYNADPDASGSLYVKEGGFCSDIDLFDHQLFNICYMEALTMDPQQRVFLEVGYEALVDASLITHHYNDCSEKSLASVRKHIPETNAKLLPRTNQTQSNERPTYTINTNLSNTGVFVGVCLPDWTYSMDISSTQPHTGTGLVPSLVSNRFSYCFGMKGPSLSIDTACSASLVALDVAVMKLRNSECDTAIVGGVQLNLSPFPFVAFCKARLLSPDGRTKTFDALADGYGRGEGCGVVVLERTKTEEYQTFEAPGGDAEGTKRRIWGAVRGSAIGHNGMSANLVAPNGSSQQKVIRRALECSRVPLSQIRYFETHGTGTALGDPIEVAAILEVFKPKAKEIGTHQRALILGAVKTNIGHLEAAAGIAGLIKIVLTLSQRFAPSVVHFQQLNPNIEGFIESSFFIPRNSMPISYSKTQEVTSIDPSVSEEELNSQSEMFGCLSSFGFGGALAHAVISSPNLPLLCLPPLLNTSLTFIFTGQGFNTVERGRHLFEVESVYRNTILQVSEAVRPYLNGINLVDIFLAREKKTLPTEIEDGNNVKRWRDPSIPQVALFAVQVSLLKLLESKGLAPDVVIGHSLGEYAAAVAAGVFSVNTAARLVAIRAGIMCEPSYCLNQGMMALRLSIQECELGLEEFKKLNMKAMALGVLSSESCSFEELSSVWIAAINGEHSVVLSGILAAINEFIRFWERKKGAFIAHAQLEVERAYHTPLMMEAQERFAKQAIEVLRDHDVELNAEVSKAVFISTVTGQTIKPNELLSHSYWCQHMVKPVQFLRAVNILQTFNSSAIMEIGMKSQFNSVVKEFIQSNFDGSKNSVVPKWFAINDWLPDGSTPTNTFSSLLQNIQLSVKKHTRCTVNSIFKRDRSRFPLHKFGVQITSNDTRTKKKTTVSTIQTVEFPVTTTEAENSLEWIASIFLQSTGLDWDSIETDSILLDTGLDSLSFFTFRNELKRKFTVDIPIAFFASRNLTKKQVEEFLIAQIASHHIGSLHAIQENNHAYCNSSIEATPLSSFPSTPLYGSPWLEQLPKPPVKLRLICFPYGGGSTDVFAAWTYLVPTTVEILPVLFPGRSVRFQEDSLDNINEAATSFYSSSLSIFDSKIPYALLGISVGAIIAFEVCLLIGQKHHNQPIHFFPICCPHPTVYRKATVRAAEVYRKLNNRKQKPIDAFQPSSSSDTSNGSSVQREVERSRQSENVSQPLDPGFTALQKTWNLRFLSSRTHKKLEASTKTWSMMTLEEVVNILQEDVKRKEAIRRGEIVSPQSKTNFQNERNSAARGFIMDFLQAANFRGIGRIRENPEFADAWASVFSGDAAMALKYKGNDRPKLTIPITAIEGSLDAVSRLTIRSMRDWCQYTSASFNYALIRGGDHYLVHDKSKETVDVILKTLSNHLVFPPGLHSYAEGSGGVYIDPFLENIMNRWYNRAAAEVLGRMKRI